jgi:hypothetical protein
MRTGQVFAKKKSKYGFVFVMTGVVIVTVVLLSKEGASTKHAASSIEAIRPEAVKPGAARTEASKAGTVESPSTVTGSVSSSEAVADDDTLGLQLD